VCDILMWSMCVQCCITVSLGTLQLCEWSDLGVAEADVSSVVSCSAVFWWFSSWHRSLLRQFTYSLLAIAFIHFICSI